MTVRDGMVAELKRRFGLRNPDRVNDQWLHDAGALIAVAHGTCGACGGVGRDENAHFRCHECDGTGGLG